MRPMVTPGSRPRSAGPGEIKAPQRSPAQGIHRVEPIVTAHLGVGDRRGGQALVRPIQDPRDALVAVAIARRRTGGSAKAIAWSRCSVWYQTELGPDTLPGVGSTRGGSFANLLGEPGRGRAG